MEDMWDQALCPHCLSSSVHCNSALFAIFVGAESEGSPTFRLLFEKGEKLSADIRKELIGEFLQRFALRVGVCKGS